MSKKKKDPLQDLIDKLASIKEETQPKKLTRIASRNPEPAIPALPVYSGGFENAAPISQAIALREARRIRQPIADKLWKWYYDPGADIALTDIEEEQRRRLANAWDLLSGKVLNDRKAVLAHITWCKDNYMDISERTAYDDIRKAKNLFGDPRANTTVFEKRRISEILLGQIQKMIEVQEVGGSIEKIEAAKSINQLTRRFNAINGLESDINTQVPRPAITINFNSDEETLRRQAEELMKDATIDITHTEE